VSLSLNVVDPLLVHQFELEFSEGFDKYARFVVGAPKYDVFLSFVSNAKINPFSL